MQGIKLPYNKPEVDAAAYEAWLSEGTLLRATQKLKDAGIVSFRKKPFSPDGVRKAAIRHMTFHFDDTKKMLTETYLHNGYIVEENQVERLMIKMAVSALRNPQRVKYWLIEHDLLEKYKDFVGSLITIA